MESPAIHHSGWAHRKPCTVGRRSAEWAAEETTFGSLVIEADSADVDRVRRLRFVRLLVRQASPTRNKGHPKVGWVPVPCSLQPTHEVANVQRIVQTIPSVVGIRLACFSHPEHR